MSVSGISSSLYTLQGNQSNCLAQIRKDFESLGSALQSGDLSDAKKAFARLQQGIASQGGNSGNPMSSDLETLGTALDSGDIEAAQEAYNSILAKLSQGPQGSAEGKRAAAPGDAVTLSGDNAAAKSSSTVYDVRDSNQDGFVSFQEEVEYAFKHPGETVNSRQTSKASDNSGGVGNILNIKA